MIAAASPPNNDTKSRSILLTPKLGATWPVLELVKVVVGSMLGVWLIRYIGLNGAPSNRYSWSLVPFDGSVTIFQAAKSVV